MRRSERVIAAQAEARTGNDRGLCEAAGVRPSVSHQRYRVMKTNGRSMTRISPPREPGETRPPPTRPGEITLAQTEKFLKFSPGHQVISHDLKMICSASLNFYNSQNIHVMSSQTLDFVVFIITIILPSALVGWDLRRARGPENIFKNTKLIQWIAFN